MGENERLDEWKVGDQDRDGRRIVRGSKVRKEIWESLEEGSCTEPPLLRVEERNLPPVTCKITNLFKIFQKDNLNPS